MSEGIRAVLVHGMGRTPLSMLPLASRLRRRGIKTRLFGYSATFESLQGCTARLARLLEQESRQSDLIVVGHSLGTVLLRAACAHLTVPPKASFFLAPPTTASRAARFFVRRFLYRVLTGEMGRLLADSTFMNNLPAPSGVTRIYAGTAGPVGQWSPFGSENNDGILAVHETAIPGIPVIQVPKLHSFIMNSRAIAEDILETCERLQSRWPWPHGG